MIDNNNKNEFFHFEWLVLHNSHGFSACVHIVNNRQLFRNSKYSNQMQCSIHYVAMVMQRPFMQRLFLWNNNEKHEFKFIGQKGKVKFVNIIITSRHAVVICDCLSFWILCEFSEFRNFVFDLHAEPFVCMNFSCRMILIRKLFQSNFFVGNDLASHFSSNSFVTKDGLPNSWLCICVLPSAKVLDENLLLCFTFQNIDQAVVILSSNICIVPTISFYFLFFSQMTFPN